MKKENQCVVPGCEQERELYAVGDYDTQSSYCAYHGETEEGWKETEGYIDLTDTTLSCFIKHEFKRADEDKAVMFWVNHYIEGRKDAGVSIWVLESSKPTNLKVRYYPAYSKEYFVNEILPNLVSSNKITKDKDHE